MAEGRSEEFKRFGVRAARRRREAARTGETNTGEVHLVRPNRFEGTSAGSSRPRIRGQHAARAAAGDPTPPSTSESAPTWTRSTAWAGAGASVLRPATRTALVGQQMPTCRGHGADGTAGRSSRAPHDRTIMSSAQAVAKFHTDVDHARAQGMRPEWVFETARRLTRWHYQWAVIHDFLPRFIGDELVGPNGTVYKEVAGKPPVINLSYYKPTNRDGRPFMPVEFAVAAYRFGHSLIRPFYVINQTTLDRGGVPVFGPDGGFNLNGGRPIPPDLVMEWKNILPVDPAFPARKPRKIDTKLRYRSPTCPAPSSRRLTRREPCVRTAARNACRPAVGQQIAKAMRAPPVQRHPRLSSDRVGRRGATMVTSSRRVSCAVTGSGSGRRRQDHAEVSRVLQRDPHSYCTSTRRGTARRSRRRRAVHLR